MIDPHWQVIDLDPVTWRNLGPYLEPSNYIRTAQPGEHGLFVLHNDGQVFRVLDSAQGERHDLEIAQVDDPRTLAHTLYESGEWDRVHVINKRHLASVAHNAQQIENRALMLDAYYHRVYELMWQSNTGYVSVPAHPGDWHGLTYSQLQDFLRALRSPATVALVVLDQQTVAIGLILQVDDGVIHTVTTLEALTPPVPLDLTAESFDALWNALGKQFAPPAAVLLCDKTAFDGLVQADDKLMYLTTVARNHPFFYRLEMN